MPVNADGSVVTPPVRAAAGASPSESGVASSPAKPSASPIDVDDGPQDAILSYGIHAGIMFPMGVRKITVHVPDDLLKKAQRETGEGVTETVRRGLTLVAASSAYERLRRMRGTVRLDIDIDDLRADRR